MRIELSGGFHLNVETWGSGSPLVLIHGFTGSARAWGRFGDLMAARHTLIAVDVAGHGDTDSPAEVARYRMEAAAADIVEAVAKIGYERPAWLGYSMGGRLALYLASQYPQRIERLALIGASPGLATETERAERRAADELLARNIEADGVPAFIDYWENIPMFASQKTLSQEVRGAIRAGRLQNTVTGLANSLRGMGTGSQPPTFDALPSLPFPVLLVSGALDVKFTGIAGEMTKVIPDARCVTIPGAGHAAQTDRPDECAAAILEFLALPVPRQGVPA